MKLFRYFLLFALSAPCVAFAQTKFLPTIADARNLADDVVASVAAGNYDGAWKGLRPVSVVPPSEMDVFEAQFSSRATSMRERFGAPVDYELVREESAGKSLLRFKFLVRMEKAPMRWQLTFYRAPKGWVVTDFTYDDNMASLFPNGG